MKFCTLKIVVELDGDVVGKGEAELSSIDIYRIIREDLKDIVTVTDINGNSGENFTLPDYYGEI